MFHAKISMYLSQWFMRKKIVNICKFFPFIFCPSRGPKKGQPLQLNQMLLMLPTKFGQNWLTGSGGKGVFMKKLMDRWRMDTTPCHKLSWSLAR